MEVLDTILDAIGHTPLVRLRKVTRGLQPTILAKVESLNPGGSIKDRIGLRMIEAAERAGKLRPGGTIVEPTSGNTGVGLAIAAAIKGYRMVFVMPDKMSQEKISLLQAYGAEVVITPTAVPRESPESYYSVADRLSGEIPGAFQPNQYFNPANPQAHYETTGPELWAQTEGRISHFVAGMGTGGTISGVSRFLKERKPGLVTVGADPEGSLYSGDTPRPYKVEGIGEDFYPATMDLSLVDRIVRVSDRDSFLMARRVTREEGILVGGSAGSALCAALEVARELGPEHLVVVIFPDTGRNYLSKLYNDGWMRQNGFLVQFPARTVRELLAARSEAVPPLVAASAVERVGEAINRMQHFGISQMPVADEGEPTSVGKLVGSIQERTLLDRVYRDPGLVESAVGAAMDPPFPTISADASIDQAFELLLNGTPALVVVESGRPVTMLAKLDLLEFVAHRRF
ncbi:MAG: cystathionine beta-synthase [Chloroflexi bacterium]|nr:cystathionine beta-synthase [Chloroflexota bacterium]